MDCNLLLGLKYTRSVYRLVDLHRPKKTARNYHDDVSSKDDMAVSFIKRTDVH